MSFSEVTSPSGSVWTKIKQNDLRSLTPVTPEDYMCWGYALGRGTIQEKSLSCLDKAVAMRDSPIAHAFRAAQERYWRTDWI